MQNETEIFYDDFDAKIYEAMLELGWIIPKTEEEVEIAERGLKDVEIPPFDFDGCLERIKERIRNGEV